MSAKRRLLFGGGKKAADLLIMLGQSNADGFGLVSNYPATTAAFYETNNPRVFCYFKPTRRTVIVPDATNNDVGAEQFIDNGQWYRLGGTHSDALKITHQTVQGANSTIQIQTPVWAGSEGGAALEYVLQNPNRELWIVKCAIGASRIETNWQMTGRGAGGIYDYFLNHVYLPAKRRLLASGRTIRSVKVFWMQGEGDTTLTTYQTSLQNFVNNIVADVVNPSPMQIIIGGLNAGTGYGTAANVLDTKMRQWHVAVTNPTTELLVTDGSYGAAALPVQADQIHYTEPAYETLGRRLYDPATVFTRKVTPLRTLVPSTVFELDSTVGMSANFGNVWQNLCTAPADSSARGAYDYTLGASSAVAADDPTLTGTPDAASTFWSFDGGDFFQLAGANTTFLNNIHKTTGGQAFWVAFSFLYLDTAGGTNPVIFTTRDFFGEGLTVRVTGSTDRVQLTQRGTVAEAASTSAGVPALVNGTNYFVMVTAAAGGSGLKFYFNSATPINETITYDTATANASQIARIGNGYAGSTFLPTGSQNRHFSAGNAVLSDAEAGLILAQMRTRHGLAYA